MTGRSTFLRPCLILLGAVAIGMPDAGSAQERRHPDSTSGGAPHHHTGHRSAGAPALLTGLGDWHHRTSSRIPRAQQFFDQGLRLAYAFSFDESVRSFTEAARLDTACAICWWGVAYALGPNINLPMTADVETRALAAIRNAQRLAARASPSERSYIDAMSLRFGEPAGADRAARDSAYATAMGDVARRWKADIDAKVLYADALLNLRPWNQWTSDGAPQPGTLGVVALLERAIASAPNHAGACHFYVHAVEASPTPQRALPCAERLPRLMPGAGHVVHMPAHVYLRVGRYADAARANIAAMKADRRYVSSSAKAGDFYPTFYPPHNEHFLWMTYVMSGQRAKALAHARALTRSVSVADARANASLEAFLSVAPLTHVRFGDWDAALAEPAPPAELRYLRGMWHYAQGRSHIGRGDLAAASLQLDSLRSLAASVPASVIVILNPAPVVLELAASVLAGQLALRQGRTDIGLNHLRDAVRRETALTYDEPRPWYHSTRHMLGVALLGAGDGASAEAAFRDDLRVNPENGWGLAGLERALRLQKREREANEIAARLRAAWRDADVPAIAGQ